MHLTDIFLSTRPQYRRAALWSVRSQRSIKIFGFCFRQKLKLLKKVFKNLAIFSKFLLHRVVYDMFGYFSKFILHRIAYGLDQCLKILQACWVMLRGVAGPYPFLVKIKFGHFFKILFTSSSLWPRKIILKLFRYIRSTWGAGQDHTYF